MIKVGLTGNIGSGKSLVAKIFESLQIPVFNADDEAKKILDSPKVIIEIKRLFGHEIIFGNRVDRKALAQIVFNDHTKLDQLNSIIHPAVRGKFATWAGQQTASPYVIYEAAILIESGHYLNMDKIILVTAPEELRIKRVMERDGATKAMVQQRMANQWPEEKKVKYADFIIKNDESELLIPQVLKIDKCIGVRDTPPHPNI